MHTNRPRFRGVHALLSRAVAAWAFLCLALAAAGRVPDDAPPAKAEKTAAERAAALEDQARLWLEAERLRRDGKQEECRDALGKAVALEKELFAGPTHTLLHVTEHFAAAADRCKDAEAARRARLDAVAVQAAFLGDRPGKVVVDNADRLRQALDVRQKALWQVDDEGTRALMVEFYHNLWERKLDKLDSLRQAQIAMLRGKLYRPRSSALQPEEKEPRLPPYYWAAFTLSGN